MSHLRLVFVFTLLVSIVDVLLFTRISKQVQQFLMLERREESLRPPGALARSLPATVSYAADGQRLQIPADVNWVVVFVLHSGHEQFEIESWHSVSRELNEPRFLMVGCCQDRSCLSRVVSPFPVVIDLPLLLARNLAILDQDGRFLIVNRTRPVAHAPLSRTNVVSVLRSIRDNGRP
jgi:hypothetical protein